MRSKTERPNGSKRGRPAKISAADECAIYHARELDPPVAWKDLVAQYHVARSVLAEAYRRAQLRFSGQKSS